MSPAPLGKKQTLEKLAESYRENAAPLSMAPTHLTPKKRRQFLDQVFSQVGYSYSSTLLALSRIDKSAINQHHKDLKQLLFLPNYDKKYQNLNEIFSQEEIDAISRIEILFK